MTRTRPVPLIAVAASALVLAGCAATPPAEPSPAPTTPAATTAAPTTSTAAPSATETEASPTSSALNCASVTVDDRILESADWGLREQLVVTGGEFNADFGLAPAAPLVTIDRGLNCEYYGSGFESGQRFTYVETSSDLDELTAWAERLGYEATEQEGGSTHYLQPQTGEGHGWQSWLVIGDEFVVGGTGVFSAATQGAITGVLRNAEPESQVLDHFPTQSCSMFFGPQSGTEAGPMRLPNTGIVAFDAASGTAAIGTGRDYDNVDPSTTLCEGIVWHEGGTDALPTGEPVASNEVRELYEVGADTYVAVFENGVAEITAPQEIAEQVLPPMFRGAE